MDKDQTRENTAHEKATEQGVKNPFENNQPADKDVEQSQELLDNEQQYKEAMTERD